MTEITLNCLIIPIGKLMNILCIKVMQSITIYKASTYRELETVIQSRLGAPFNKIPLKFCIIQARSGIEKKMDEYDMFDGIFTSTEEPKRSPRGTYLHHGREATSSGYGFRSEFDPMQKCTTGGIWR
ncbi:unnamed protein product [Rhizophagus irregularis]|nr:unnamed protein product [Rhizophagus irregularis]